MEIFNSVNPANGNFIASNSPYSISEINNIIDIANKNFKQWRKSDISQRINYILSIRDRLGKFKSELAELITLEMGKPISQSISEIEKCIFLCEYYSNNVNAFLQEKIIKTDGRISKTILTPMGVILGIMPWNFPVWQALRFAIPAICAGNTVIIKHSPNTCLTAMKIEEVMAEKLKSEFKLYHNIIAEVNNVEEIICNETIKGVSITGSEHAGRAVAQIAGKNIKKSVLELGGSDPFIVLNDADIEKAAKIAVQSRLFNSGQTCISAKRFIIEAGVYDKFMGLFVENHKRLRIGDPLNESTDIGPLARKDLIDNLKSQLTRSISMGASIKYQHHSEATGGFFFPPTIVENVTLDMPILKEETFGPVSPCIKVNSIKEALEIANDSIYGLAATVFSKNEESINYFINNLNVGHVAINGLVKSDPRLPFGGCNHSGYGKELGEKGIEEFSLLKSIWIG